MTKDPKRFSDPLGSRALELAWERHVLWRSTKNTPTDENHDDENS